MLAPHLNPLPEGEEIVKRALGAFVIFVILSKATRSRRIPPRHEKICRRIRRFKPDGVFPRDDDVLHRELISRLDSFSISRVLKFLGKYREAGLLLLRASVGLIFILICAPVLLSGEHRWWQFGSAMRVFNFHSHLDWWGFLGALSGCIGGIFMILGFAFRIGILLAFLVALVNAIAVAHHEHALYSIMIPIEAVIILVCLSFIGPGKYSVDKG